ESPASTYTPIIDPSTRLTGVGFAFREALHPGNQFSLTTSRVGQEVCAATLNRSAPSRVYCMESFCAWAAQELMFAANPAGPDCSTNAVCPTSADCARTADNASLHCGLRIIRLANQARGRK